MKLRDILNAKGTQVYTTAATATLAEVVAKLVENNCGSLVVCSDGEMVGIITERDILRSCADRSLGTLEQRPVGEVMTTKVITGEPNDRVESIMGLMTQNRIRHLPVIDDGKLAGMISIGDVVKAQHDHLTMENHYLKTYIQS